MPNSVLPVENANFLNDRVKTWFENMISNLKVDQVLLETNVASKEQKYFFDTLINGGESDIHALGRVQSSMYFIKNLIQEYINELTFREAKPLKLALDLSDAKIFVWATIRDNDDITEDALILSEAKINAKYSEHGFHISSTVVEESDKIQIPPHYQQITP